jgi:hypothetical protein
MAYYRLYFFNGSGGRIHEFREFEAADDLAAIHLAAEWRGPEPMELWSGGRKVRRWDAPSLVPKSPPCRSARAAR